MMTVIFIYDNIKLQEHSESTNLRQRQRAQTCANAKEHKHAPTPKFQPKVIQDSHPIFQLNPDPDVRQICPKMLWMHYLVGVSDFTKYGSCATSDPVSTRMGDCLWTGKQSRYETSQLGRLSLHAVNVSLWDGKMSISFRAE